LLTILNSKNKNREDGYQIDGLTFATIVVLEFPPKESWQNMIMSQRKQWTQREERGYSGACFYSVF